MKTSLWTYLLADSASDALVCNLIHMGEGIRRCFCGKIKIGLVYGPIFLCHRGNKVYFLCNVLFAPSQLHIHLFVNHPLLIHIKGRQEIIDHQNHIDISRLDALGPDNFSASSEAPP